MDFRTRLGLQQLDGRDMPSVAMPGMPESPTAPHDNVHSSETATGLMATTECTCTFGLTPEQQKQLDDLNAQLQSLTNDERAVVQEQIKLQDQRDGQQAALAILNQRLINAQDRAAEAVKAFNDYKATVRDWYNTQGGQDRYGAAMKAKGAVEELQGSITELKDLIKGLQDKIEALNAKAVQLRKDIAATEAAIAAIKPQENCLHSDDDLLFASESIAV